MKRLLILFLLFNLAVNAQQPINWPNNKKAVVVLTYDDGLNSQLDIAIPQLDSMHFTATFFLTGYITNDNLPKWRAVSAKGYELANHTLYHPCLMTTVKGNNGTGSENYSVFSMVREITMMNNYLFAVDGKTTRTYAYPCTETAVGPGVSYVDSLRKSGLIKYARIGGENDAVVTDFKNLDPLLVPAWGMHGGNTAAELIAFVQKAQKTGGMVVFMFHGVGGDYLTQSAAVHRELLQYLAKNQDIWVASFQQAMDYISKASK